MKILTSAKINISLDVTGKLPNGYHTIESVFQTVGIYDEITVDLVESNIELTCEVPEKFSLSDKIPCDERNIAYKAARKFFEENGLDNGCRIHIKKGIPSQAGLGGGSTDAAAVLYCLSRLTGKNFSAPEKLGADVPFFLTGGTAYVEGIGEKITPIADYSNQPLVIAKGIEGVSTGKAYSCVDSLVSPVHPNTKALINAIENCRENAYKFVGNLFEAAVYLPEVDDIKQIMTSHGSLSSCMTGSGSAVFGIFNNMETAKNCAKSLENSGYFAQACKTVKNSFVIL